MVTRDYASCRCPRCRTSFRTLPDEVGDHDCPRCGYGPEDVIYETDDKEDGD